MSETRGALYSRILKELEAEVLPSGIQLYAVDGRRLYEIRDASGYPTSNLIYYLITKVGDDWFKYAVELDRTQLVDLNLKGLIEVFDSGMRSALVTFQRFLADPEELKKARGRLRETTAILMHQSIPEVSRVFEP